MLWWISSACVLVWSQTWPALLGEKVVGESHINAIEGEVVRLVIVWNSLMKVEELVV